MAAENKTGGPSFSPADAQGYSAYPSAGSQINRPVLLTGASLDQSYAIGSPQTPILGATSVQVQIVPAVHATRHPLTVCMASSVSTAASFSSYTPHVRPLYPSYQQANGSVVVSPVQQQQNVTRTVPAVRHAAQPTAVLDLGNNGILNAVLGRLPNVGTMVVHNLDPGSLIQKNIVAMIDSRSTAVTTAAAVSVVNLSPVLTLSHQATVTLEPPSYTGSHITHRVSQHPLQPIIVNQSGSKEPLVASSLTAKQHIAFSQSLVTNACPLQPSLQTPAVMRHAIRVRTLANSSGQSQLCLSVSQAGGSRFPLVNSAEMIPRIKLPRTASSLPGAIVRHYTTTTVQAVQQSSASQIQPNVSLPAQAQLVATVPTFVCRNTVSASGINTTSASSTLTPSESLTTIIPVTIPFDVSQSYVNARSADDNVATLSTPSPLMVSSSAIAMCHAGDHTSAAHSGTSLFRIPTSTNIVSNSNSSLSLFSAHHTYASYVPASVPPFTVHHFSDPSAVLHQEQVSFTAKTKKVSVKRTPQKRAPRKRTTSTACPASGDGMNVNQAKILQPVFHSSAVGMPDVSANESNASVVADPLSYAAASCASRSALVAGVKRKCSPGQKYTLLLENGCKYSSVYFDGEGFQAKKPTISSAQSGSCCY